MARKQKLELTWIGKENRPKLEPRILLEDPEKSYHAAHRVTDDDIFDNRLIFGDNLLALKALEQELAGRVRCIFIDPPYNTGAAFEQYDDGVEHSVWLGLMHDRISILKRLLSEDGSLWMTIDDNECHYLKVMCDEIFGRNNFVSSIAWEKDEARHNDAVISGSHDHVLVYANDMHIWRKTRNLLPREESGNARYKNTDDDPRGPWLQGACSTAKSGSERNRFPVTLPSGREAVPPPGNYWRFAQATLEKAVKEDRVYFGKDGDRLPIIKTYLSEVQQGFVPKTWWPASEVGSNQSARRDHLRKLLAGIEPFATPKPEELIARIVQISTDPGDIVLDSFAGSGTTGAVAHKMGRRWVMIELGDHCHSHIIPRLRKVIDGEDHGGISADEQLVWESKLNVTKIRKGDELYQEMLDAQKGHEQDFARFQKKLDDGHLRLYGIVTEEDKPIGGGFRYYTLAPSLLEEDEFGNWIINKRYNPEMLTEALCKLEGFTYAPSGDYYWQHGHSTETDFIYVTTQTLTREQLVKLSDEVGPKRSLLVCCGAYRIRKLEDFPNLTLKKIPRAVMSKCEWGKDDYSLEIKALPDAPEPEPVEFDEVMGDLPKSKRKALKVMDQQASLFGMGDVE